jgi:hypothetical protein
VKFGAVILMWKGRINWICYHRKKKARCLLVEKEWKETEHKNWKFVKSWGKWCYIINPAA